MRCRRWIRRRRCCRSLAAARRCSRSRRPSSTTRAPAPPSSYRIRSTRSTKARHCLPAPATWCVNADAAASFAHDWHGVPQDVWARTQLLYVCSPDNPTGRVFGLDEWRELFALSDRYGFVIASDECYSEIYFDEAHPPLGALAAAHALGREGYPRLAVFGSLSKRSNAPGLRSGYVAGDAALMKAFLLYRTYHGAAMSPAVAAASIAAWNDEAHVDRQSRRVRGQVRGAAADACALAALRHAGRRVLPLGANPDRRRAVRAAPAGRGERGGRSRQLPRPRCPWDQSRARTGSAWRWSRLLPNVRRPSTGSWPLPGGCRAVHSRSERFIPVPGRPVGQGSQAARARP